MVCGTHAEVDQHGRSRLQATFRKIFPSALHHPFSFPQSNSKLMMAASSFCGSVSFIHQTSFLHSRIHHPRFRQHTKSSCTLHMSTTTKPFGFPRRVSRAAVWFRDGDLRVEDHPGLDAACAHTSDALAPLLVCTPFTKPTTLDAIRRLKNEVEGRGSRLFLLYAEDEASAVIDFLKDFRADRVHVRMDIEHEAREVISTVERVLDGITTVETWNSELRDWDDDTAEFLSALPSEYPQFLRWPVRAKTSVLSSTAEFQPELILPGPGLHDSVSPAEDILEKIGDMRRKDTELEEIERRYEKDQRHVRALSFDSSVERFGEHALKEFLKLSDAYHEPEAARSLAEVFRQGALSPWRMHEIVHDYERRNGRIWRLLYREGSKMILDWLDAREFATLMARRDLSMKQTVDGEHQAKFWRWNGFLIRYVEEGRATNGEQKKPPLLLVHGFGASSQHFGRSLRVLKERYHVFAPDLLGFGRSEKPPAQYTQVFWEKMLWDFTREVVQEPAFVAGNSIGGYLACAFGADAYPTLCLGICLINSAGKLTDINASPSPAPARDGVFQYVMKRSRLARKLFGSFLLRSLRGRVQNTLQMVYPKNPEAADEALAREIRRNSLDYGAAGVIASGFILPRPRSLSTLLAKYSGPLLVFQGELDPLNDARKRADTIQQQYPAATVVRVQAGHCPHEEVSDQFVEAISSWMDYILENSVALAGSRGVEKSIS